VVGGSPRAAERRQLRALLSLFGLRFATFPQERREAILRAWCDSRIPQRRAAFQALRKGTLHFDAVLPGSLVYEATGYPGALGPPESESQPLATVTSAARSSATCRAGRLSEGGLSCNLWERCSGMLLSFVLQKRVLRRRTVSRRFMAAGGSA